MSNREPLPLDEDDRPRSRRWDLPIAGPDSGLVAAGLWGVAKWVLTSLSVIFAIVALVMSQMTGDTARNALSESYFQMLAATRMAAWLALSVLLAVLARMAQAEEHRRQSGKV